MKRKPNHTKGFKKRIPFREIIRKQEKQIRQLELMNNWLYQSYTQLLERINENTSDEEQIIKSISKMQGKKVDSENEPQEEVKETKEETKKSE